MGMTIHLQSGTLLGLGAAVSWSVATILIKQWGEEFDTWVLTAYQMLFGGITLFVCSMLLEKPHFLISGTSITILLWLAIMASIVQFAGWFTVLRKGDPGKTSAFLFLAPLFGVLSGWLLLDEKLGVNVLFGGILTFIGIFLVNWNPLSRRESRLKKAYHINGESVQ
jgi:drug/metabolite transporter (DMT)-like permease